MMNQEPGLILFAVFAYGTVTGLLLAVGIAALDRFTRRHMDKRSRAREKYAALLARAEQPVEIDDDCMLCPVCWESRHPGQTWSLRIGSFCMEHLLLATPLGREENDQILVLQR